MFRVGITPDFVGVDGTTLFDRSAYRILDAEPGIEYEVMEVKADEITPDQAAAYDAIMILMPKVTERSLSRADRRLVHISRFGVGYEIIDLGACTRHGVAATITPQGVARPVATMALTFMLALAQKLLTKDRLTRQNRWHERTLHMGMGLSGRTLGCVGAGNTARELVRVVAPFGMTCLAYDPYADPAEMAELGIRLVPLDVLLAEADFVSIHVPLLDETRGLIGAAEFARMKPTAYLVNTSRGPVVDEAALVEALTGGGIAGAGLDVFAVEPVQADNPLLGLDNVVLAPHSLCWTDECWLGCAETAFRNIVSIFRGELPASTVNRDVVGHDGFVARLGELARQNGPRGA